MARRDSVSGMRARGGSCGGFASYARTALRTAVATAWLAIFASGCDAILGIEDRPLRPAHSPYYDAVTGDTPVLYLRFGEDAGIVAHDEMNHDNGTYSAAATLGYPGAIHGDPNTAVMVDGTGGITMPASADFSPMESFTVEVWVRPSSNPVASNVAFVVDHETFSPGRAGWDIAAGTKTLFERRADAMTGLSATAPAVSAGQWHHLVSTFDGPTSRMAIWIDGVSAVSVIGAPGVPAIPQGWSIGAQNCGCNGNAFVGAIDELAIYPAVLSDARIRAHYAAANPPDAGSQDGGG
jgi:hypothetical protein